MIEHALLVANALQTAWAIDPPYLSTLANVLVRAATGHAAPAAALNEASEARAARDARRTDGQKIAGGVAVIPIYGVITQRATLFSEVSGMASCQQISAAIAEALAEPSVDTIVLDIDSPGGSVSGIQELADEIQAASAKKPIVAIANSLAASAAYWLGSQASEFYCTPSGMTGSIGVYSLHEDWSKAMEAEGIKVTLVSAGKFKTEGNPYGPINPEARAHMQSTIDGYYGAFTRQVARGRGVPVSDVRNGMGQGRCLLAADAKSANMIDGIRTFAETIAGARRRPTSGSDQLRRARASAVARQRETELRALERSVEIARLERGPLTE